MNKNQVLQFKKRWKNVNRIEDMELSKMSVKEKFLKTISSMQLGFALGYSMDEETANSINKVRQRWIALKKSPK